LSDFIVSKKYSALFPGIKDIIDGTIKKYLLRVNVKETGKYLASQKSSFLLFVILGGLIFISGLIKLIRFYVSVPFQMLNVATSIHDISAIIFGILLAVHILLVIVRRSNWPLLKSWLDGKTPQ
jgi:cytochrome b subunit of formate dehydrogenase